MRYHRRKKRRNIQWMKYVIFIFIFFVFAIGIAMYSLPFMGYYQIESSVIKKNADKLASYMDLNELKKNLKVQKGQRVIRNLKKEDSREPMLVDLAIQWSALATDQEIERAVTTEGLYIFLSGAGIDRKKPDAIKPPTDVSSYELIKGMIANASFQYHSHEKFVVSVKDVRGRYVGYFSFVFLREGFHWRLANVIIPLF